MFTSYSFLFFFIAVFLLYWFVFKNSNKWQNIILLIASYYFYGVAEWRMLPLLIITTIVFFFLAKGIGKTENEKKASILTTIGVVIGAGILLYFKYFGFFIESFSSFLTSIGLHTNWHSFKILMPLGVSYFTFKLISYVIEVHRGKMNPCDDFIVFANYVAFFPTIMAGPIDRPNNFIPQFYKKRQFDQGCAIDGVQQILWGLFKKIAIADNLGMYVDSILGNVESSSGSSIVFALTMYTFQMYADFSGYSDMAIGVGKLLGIKVQKNFNYPFFATNIAEFWRRWHISLTGWLTDYVFIPLNVKFRDLGKIGIMLAIIINMILVGMWHGANWTYAIFGLYQGLLFIPIIFWGNMSKRPKLKTTRFGLPCFHDIIKMLGIFLLYTIGTILFRAENLSQSLLFLEKMITNINETPIIPGVRWLVTSLFTILLMLCIEWKQRTREFGLQFDNDSNLLKILMIDYFIIMVLFVFGNFGANQFIYFQF